jgi:hypothetical protein
MKKFPVKHGRSFLRADFGEFFFDLKKHSGLFRIFKRIILSLIKDIYCFLGGMIIV